MLARGEVLRERGVSKATTNRPLLMVSQCQPESEYGLTFFDSLIAARPVFLRVAGRLTPQDFAQLGARRDLPFGFSASCVRPEIKAPRIGFPDAVHAPESPGSPVQATHFTAAGASSDRRPWRWQFGSRETREPYDLVLLLRTLRLYPLCVPFPMRNARGPSRDIDVVQRRYGVDNPDGNEEKDKSLGIGRDLRGDDRHRR